jgi:hypothetical protein
VLLFSEIYLSSQGIDANAAIAAFQAIEAEEKPSKNATSLKSISHKPVALTACNVQPAPSAVKEVPDSVRVVEPLKAICDSNSW